MFQNGLITKLETRNRLKKMAILAWGTMIVSVSSLFVIT